MQNCQALPDRVGAGRQALVRQRLPRGEERDRTGVIEEFGKFGDEVLGLAPTGRHNQEGIAGGLCQCGHGERPGRIGSGDRQCRGGQSCSQSDEGLVGAYRLGEAVQNGGGYHSHQSMRRAEATRRRVSAELSDRYSSSAAPAVG